MPSKIRVGYVEESFASPLLQLAARDDSGIELVSCPSGTGQVMSRLKAGEIDMAIALTEALIAGIVKKTAEYKIVGTYVTSPLNWAVITGLDTPYQSIDDLRGQNIGISRIGSGSQVMASYMALKHGWRDEQGQLEPVPFKVLDSFQNLRDGVNDGRAAAFLWEQQTTRPYLNEVRFIGNVLTPWSSWFIVAKPELLQSQGAAVRAFLSSLTSYVQAFDAADARQTTSKDFIVKHFGYPEQEVVEWLKTLEYPTTNKGHSLEVVEKRTIELTLDTLEQAGVVQKPEEGWNMQDFVDQAFAQLV